MNSNSNVELSCVAGSGYPRPFAIVSLAEDLRDAIENPDVRRRVHAELEDLLDQVNREVEPYERLELITIAKEPWLIENGFLTPTMKIKRSRIEDAFESSVDDWYSAGQRIVWKDAAQAR